MPGDAALAVLPDEATRRKATVRTGARRGRDIQQPERGTGMPDSNHACDPTTGVQRMSAS